MHERKGINYIEANQLTITKISYNFFILETAEFNLKFEFESAMSLISIVYLTVCILVFIGIAHLAGLLVLICLC